MESEIQEKKSIITLINGDSFLEINKLEDNSIHAVITDPPYGAIEFTASELEKLRSGSGGIWRLPPNIGNSKRNPLPRFSELTKKEKVGIQNYFEKLGMLLLPKIVPGGHIIMSSQVLVSARVQIGLEEAGFEYRGQIIRVYNTMRGGDRPKFAEKEMSTLQVSLRGGHEPWLVFRKPIPKGVLVKENIKAWGAGALSRISEDKPFVDVIYSSITPKKEKEISKHPTAKSQKLMRELVKLVSISKNCTILDPFMGSGATIAAAKYLGINSIGIEVDKVFFESARNSIDLLAEITVK